MIYSGNYWLSQSEMENNASYIYSYLKARGWSINAICGMLGNMQSESSLNPGIWQGLDNGNLTGGYGLVQWTPCTKYFTWCDDRSIVYASMISNLSRILWEVQNHIQYINSEMTFDEFTKSTDTPYNLAMNFLAHYERPANPDQPWRGTQADNWYTFLSGIEPPSPGIYYPHNSGKFKAYLYVRNMKGIVIK